MTATRCEGFSLRTTLLLFFFFQIAYESGIARWTSYMFISILFAVIIATSTLFFLPKMNINEDYMNEKRRNSYIKEKKRSRNDDKTQNEENNEILLKLNEKELVGNIF